MISVDNFKDLLQIVIACSSYDIKDSSLSKRMKSLLISSSNMMMQTPWLPKLQRCEIS